MQAISVQIAILGDRFLILDVSSGESQKRDLFSQHISILRKNRHKQCAHESSRMNPVGCSGYLRREACVAGRKEALPLLLSHVEGLQVDSGHVGIDRSNRGTG